ncbi:MAG: hypothetical protein HRU76_10830 [Phycisphaeraceae bacterium]|nr:MAG: hypothetical protein HRU76_10830 [Phycisphaeraceae bacterium]
MKSLMRALGILCVVNMLALLLLAGWLLGTDRLTPQRLLAIRAMLSTTAAQERARLDAEQAEQKRLEAEQVRREREQNPDPPADALVQRQARAALAERDRQQGLAAEIEHLRAQIRDAQQALASERVAFEQERAAWERSRKIEQSKGQDEQFQRVVRLLETIPATQARDTLVELMRGGQIDDAVAYLNAMKPFAASKVLRAFKGDEQPLATELLQRIRTLGGTPPADASGRATDADAAATSG